MLISPQQSQSVTHTHIYIYIHFFSLRILRKNINNLRYADDTTLMAESEEELKTLLMKVKGESERAGLKLSIQKMMIMASSPITSWKIDGETMVTVTDFIFLGSKIIAHGDCSHEIKRRLLLRIKAITNLKESEVSQLCLTLQHHGLQPATLLCPWDFPGKNTGMGCHFLLQWFFPTQGSNPGLPHCRQTPYHLSHQGSHDKPR